MPGVPSVKGAILAVAVKELRKLLDEGVLTPRHLGRWLLPGDLPIVEEPPLVSGWYEVGVLERVSLLLRDVVGGGSDDYLRELGQRAAQEVIASGRYPQLAYARRAEVQALADDRERFEAFGRDLRILTSLSASFFSFSRWTARQDPGLRRWLVEVSDAKPYSEAILLRMAGFVNEVAGLHGEPRLWYWERPRPDLVVFRMTRDI